jgi:hypothetical protein
MLPDTSKLRAGLSTHELAVNGFSGYMAQPGLNGLML